MSMTRESFTRRHWNGDLDLDTTNINVENFTGFDPLFHFDDTNDISSSLTDSEFSTYNLFQSSSPQDHLGSAADENGSKEITSSLGDQSNDSATIIGHMTGHHPKKNNIASSTKPSDMYHASLEQLSHLSLKIYRLSVVTETLAQHSNPTYDQKSFGQMETELRHPISSMIGGLQSFQELLQTLGYQGRHCADTITNHAPSAPMETPFSLADASESREASITSRRTGNPAGYHSFASTIEVHKDSLSNDKPLLNSQQNEQYKDKEAFLQHLDLPTSLLIVTCYINLVRLCRHVFHIICRCLQTVEHQDVSFATLSDLQISGISLGQDGGLQILVLGQVVSRLLDRISGWLGCPSDMVIGSVLKNDDQRRGRMVAPMLIEILQREEELQGPGLKGGGIRALKDEIRRLNETFNNM